MKTDIATTDLERQGRNVDAALPSPAPTLFEVARRGGIWEVTKDGRFYGHYHSQQPAFDAVEAAAHAAVASGGFSRYPAPRRTTVPGNRRRFQSSTMNGLALASSSA
jgi:hypothetical protein